MRIIASTVLCPVGGISSLTSVTLTNKAADAMSNYVDREGSEEVNVISSLATAIHMISFRAIGRHSVDYPLEVATWYQAEALHSYIAFMAIKNKSIKDDAQDDSELE